VLGSTELVPLLLAHGLVDEQVTSTGAILATYAPVRP
jgi:hypothetical protein